MISSVVAMIDHSVLQPTATDADVREACRLCREVGVASICVKPCHVPLAAAELAGSAVKVSTVIGFPHGGASSAIKAAETRTACDEGAQEVDMVANLGKAVAGDWSYVEADIRAVVEAARAHGAITKVIFDTGLLPNDDVKIGLCRASEAAGAAFVKTSTGYGYAKNAAGEMQATGATEHDVRLMRATCSPAIQVKASGGIRDFATASRFVELGATRLGTSSTLAIAAGERGGAAAPATTSAY
ncbi:MAG: deoxyribose-phosphate aldolase [Pirellulales bacterium]